MIKQVAIKVTEESKTAYDRMCRIYYAGRKKGEVLEAVCKSHEAEIKRGTNATKEEL